MGAQDRPNHVPFFSICIPQYNRFPFLLEALKAISTQTFRDFEVCISDDCSPEQGEKEVIRFLRENNIPHIYKRQPTNLRYDKNLREVIDMASGHYCFLHGNDDRLSGPDTLQFLYDEIAAIKPAPGVVITNYREASGSDQYLRIRQSGFIGADPVTAAHHFRNFSFVSGIIIERTLCHEYATDEWDGSEMYQMYLGCKAIASGCALFGVTRVCIEKNITFPGEIVESYLTKLMIEDDCLKERLLPMRFISRLVIAAIEPYVSDRDRNRLGRSVFVQFYSYIYLYWLIEYRRVKTRRYALGIALGLRPRNTIERLQLSWVTRVVVRGVFFWSTLFGMLFPPGLFARLYPLAYLFAKRIRKRNRRENI
jgi:glycosyltransferase involved in cell wall biosynthesis